MGRVSFTKELARGMGRGKVSLRAGSLVWVGDKEPRTGEKNEARKSEPARELLIFEFRPSRGVKSAFRMCQKTIQ